MQSHSRKNSINLNKDNLTKMKYGINNEFDVSAPSRKNRKVGGHMARKSERKCESRRSNNSNSSRQSSSSKQSRSNRSERSNDNNRSNR